MYFVFMMYTNAGEDKIIPKDATFFLGTVNQSWSTFVKHIMKKIRKKGWLSKWK